MIPCVCPGCGSKLEAKNRLAGRTVKCPKCGGPVDVPRSAAVRAARCPARRFTTLTRPAFLRCKSRRGWIVTTTT